MIQRFYIAIIYACLFLLGSCCLFGQTVSIATLLQQCQEALSQEDPVAANQYGQEALALARSRKDTLSWAHALVLAGDVADLRYQGDSALVLTLAAKDLIDAYSSAEGPFAFSFLMYQNLGVHYSRAGRYDLQMKYYQEAFAIAKQQTDADCTLLAGAYQNMLAAYYNANDVEQAFAYADTSNQLAENCGRLGILSRNYNNLGSIYADIGEYPQAISYQRKSLDLVRSARARVSGLLNLAFYLQEINRYPAALDALQEAEKITKDPENAAFYQRAEVISSLTNAYFEAGETEPFLRSYEEGIQLFVSAYQADPETADYFSYALLLNYYAGYQLDKNNPQAVIDYTTQSLAISEDYYREVAIGSYLLMGEAYEQLADYPQAEIVFQKAIAFSSGDSTYTTNLQNPSLEQILGNHLLLELLMRKADLQERYGSACDQAEKWIEAVETCELVDRAIIASRKQVFNRQSKTKLAQLAHQLYSTAITALYRLYAQEGEIAYLEKAFYFSEQDKNLLLAETLSSRSASELAKVPKAILQMEQDLSARISYFKNLLVRTQGDRAQTKAWQDSIFTLSERQRDLFRSIEEDLPVYYNLKYSNKAIDIPAVRQHLLGAKEVLLEYFLTDQYVYLILINPKESQFYRLPLNAPLGKQIGDLLDMGARQYPDFGLLSFQIYQQILAAIEDKIVDKDLVIVADAALGQVPFEALRVTPSRNGPAKISDFLLAKHGIRHLFSAQVAYQQQSRRNKKKRGGILSVSPGFKQNYQPSDTAMQQFAAGLKDLAGAQNVQNILRQHFGKRVQSLNGAAASKQAFMEIAPDFQLIHIATHALLDDDTPEFSRLVFSLQNAREPFEACLHAYEILGMDLQADLVTLSACNTAIGNPNAGDGIAGLGHAFAFAGSANLISTLWPIRDDQASKLMGTFYAGLSQGLSKPEALRQAKLSFLQNNPPTLHHPHFWAGYIYSGDGEPLDIRTRPPYAWIIGIAFTIILLLYTQRKAQRAFN